jgi:hypothetical protein
MKKVLSIFLLSLPILLMVGLIPLVQNDYFLTLLFIVIISVSLKLIRSTKKDHTVLIFGFIAMIIFEYIFISTGVETFNRNSLLGIMPLWLPFLWSYGFVAIKKTAEIL